jgi:hypothetical protein|nr:MAG TPA: hypothetical protein [Caudoviricetes sp.]
MPRIVGSVKTAAGDHVMISLYVTPKPSPVGSNNPVTDILVGGYVVQNTMQPVSIDLEPGTYDVRITGPGGVIVEKEVGLAEGQEVSLSALVGNTPVVPHPVAPVVNINVTRPEIHVVASKAEAEALPDGSYYFLIEHPASTPTLIAHVGGQYTGDTGTVTVDGKAGDMVVVALNVKAQSDQAFTWPAGWTVLVEPYWIGTQQSVIAYGPWSEAIVLKTAKAVEAGYVALSVRGGGTPTAGRTKDRSKEPTETVTVTAPKVGGAAGLVFAYAFERTASDETRSQITLSEGWELVDFAAQSGSNFQTVAVAQGKGDTDATFTYPNAQSTNGLGVQVVIPGA